MCNDQQWLLDYGQKSFEKEIMKYVFGFILAIHGLIHLLGYFKAFFETEMSKQTFGVSKPMGSIWLVTFIMFMVITVQFLTHKKWFYLAYVAVFVSQILIILAWKDAKFSTIANVIILLVGISAYATDRFHKKFDSESKQILQNIEGEDLSVISENDIVHLPLTVQNWMLNSGVIGTPKVHTVHLKQIGTMRTKPDAKWMPFEATQIFNVEDPAFVWKTKVDAMSIINMVGRDKLEHGKGEMRIKLAGLFSVVNESDNPKINSGAMLRYLAEICWFPSVALNDYLSWEAIDSNSAKATFSYKDQSVFGTFSFNDRGDFMAFEAQRYFGGNENAQLETWQITVEDHKVFHGLKIPNKSKVTWKLKDGDFHWLNLEIIAVDYNKLSL